MLAIYNESKVTNAWRSINQCNEKLYYSGQPHNFQRFSHIFPYLWSFSRLFKAWKISTLNSMTFQTFPGSVRTLSTPLISVMVSPFSTYSPRKKQSIFYVVFTAINKQLHTSRAVIQHMAVTWQTKLWLDSILNQKTKTHIFAQRDQWQPLPELQR